MLVVTQRETEWKQLDYIMVSNRWLSSVRDSRVSWAPSTHRNVKGRADHALVYGKWRRKIQSPPKRTVSKYSALNPNTAKGQTPTSKFNTTIDEKILEITSSDNQTVHQQDDNLCTAINFAIQTILPIREKQNRVARVVSQRTKALFAKRTSMGKDSKKWTNADYKKIQ